MKFNKDSPLWHPFTQEKKTGRTVFIESAHDEYLFTQDGKKIIDGISSWWVNTHGHCHPHIAQAIKDQVCKLDHVLLAGFTHEPARELSEKLIEYLGGPYQYLFLSDNGSTSVEVAIKMAFQYWSNKGVKKKTVIAFEGAYHGDTAGAMSVSSRSEFTQAFSSMLFDVRFIPVPVDQETSILAKERMSLIAANEDVAAFIFEPLVQGAAGMLMHSSEYLDELVQLAQGNGILTIADEVMTGFGRTGKPFAHQYLKARPDILCLSKGITGGVLPLGATVCRSEVYQAFYSDDRMKTFFHGHSYTGNPISCRAALASLELMKEPQTISSIERIACFNQGFADEISRSPTLQKYFSAPRFQGTIFAVDLKTNENTGYFNSSRDAIYNYFLSQDILLRPLGNTVYMMPPYCTSSENLKKMASAIKALPENLS